MILEQDIIICNNNTGTINADIYGGIPFNQDTALSAGEYFQYQWYSFIDTNINSIFCLVYPFHHLPIGYHYTSHPFLVCPFGHTNISALAMHLANGHTNGHTKLHTTREPHMSRGPM